MGTIIKPVLINHKTKLFADDLRLQLQDPREVLCVDETIKRFEKVSGLILHRDVSRKKCNVLTLGSHRNFSQWPSWVFSNNEDIKLLNSMEFQRSTISRIYIIRVVCVGSLEIFGFTWFL